MSFEYIPITERCNMSCAHCSAGATAKGEDMAWKTFVQAIKVSKDTEMITLGGGEPTLHPMFMKMLNYAISKRHKGMVGVITNGSNIDISLKLADMSEQGIISASISRDEFHDPISQTVINRYTDIGKITTVLPDEVVSKGRGINIIGAIDKCGGRGLWMRWDGKLFLCGCKKVCIGTIWDYKIPDLHCDTVDRKNGELECHGYCSERGHLLIISGVEDKLRVAKEVAAANQQEIYETEARIQILSIYAKYTEGKINMDDVNSLIFQCWDNSKFEDHNKLLAMTREYFVCTF